MAFRLTLPVINRLSRAQSISSTCPKRSLSWSNNYQKWPYRKWDPNAIKHWKLGWIWEAVREYNHHYNPVVPTFFFLLVFRNLTAISWIMTSSLTNCVINLEKAVAFCSYPRCYISMQYLHSDRKKCHLWFCLADSKRHTLFFITSLSHTPIDLPSHFL